MVTSISVQNCRARTDDQKPNLVAASCFKTMFDPNLMMAQGARSININKNMPAKRNFSFWWILPWHWSPNSAHVTWDLIWIDQYNIDFQFLKTIKLYSVQVQINEKNKVCYWYINHIKLRLKRIFTTGCANHKNTYNCGYLYSCSEGSTQFVALWVGYFYIGWPIIRVHDFSIILDGLKSMLCYVKRYNTCMIRFLYVML